MTFVCTLWGRDFLLEFVSLEIGVESVDGFIDEGGTVACVAFVDVLVDGVDGIVDGEALE